MIDSERKRLLAEVQKQLQKLWDKLEWRELTGTYSQEMSDELTQKLWREFEELEVRERELLRPGARR